MVGGMIYLIIERNQLLTVKTTDVATIMDILRAAGGTRL
jgi:hypothetical protein